MLKILNAQSKSITGAALIIAGATLLNKFVGILRDRTIAHYFGAGPVTDAYYAAFKIPDLVYNLLVVGALTAGFIPVFTKLYYRDEDKKEAWKLANNIINIMGAALLVLCGLGALFTPLLSKIITPGFSAANSALAVSLTRVMFLSPFLLGLSMVAGGILQSVRKFVLYAIAPIFYNIGIILGAIALTPWLGPTGLAWGVALGAGLHLILQLYGARHAGWRWQWIFNHKDRATRLVSKLMVPRTLGLAVSNFNILVMTALASLLPAGSVAVYNFADNLHWVPTGVIGISFGLAIFPTLSAAAAQNRTSDFVKHVADTVGQILFFVIPISLLFLLLRAQIVRVVLGSGAFDWSATVNTADALAFFSLGLLADCLIPLLARSFFSLSDTKTPFIICALASAAHIAAALLLMKPLGVAGLALADSIGGTLNASLLFVCLRRKTGGLDETRLLSNLYRISVAALAMAVAVQTLKYPLAAVFDQRYFWGIFGQGAVAGLTGLAIYLFVCYILKLPELTRFFASLRLRWLKWRNVRTTELLETKE